MKQPDGTFIKLTKTNFRMRNEQNTGWIIFECPVMEKPYGFPGFKLMDDGTVRAQGMTDQYNIPGWNRSVSWRRMGTLGIPQGPSMVRDTVYITSFHNLSDYTVTVNDRVTQVTNAVGVARIVAILKVPLIRTADNKILSPKYWRLENFLGPDGNEGPVPAPSSILNHGWFMDTGWSGTIQFFTKTGFVINDANQLFGPVEHPLGIENYCNINFSLKSTFSSIKRVYSDIVADTFFVLQDNGDLYAYGDSSYGWFGWGTTTPYSSAPVKIMTNVKMNYVRNSNHWIEKNDGTFWACGENAYQVLGIPNTGGKVYTWMQCPGIPAATLLNADQQRDI